MGDERCFKGRFKCLKRATTTSGFALVALVVLVLVLEFSLSFEEEDENENEPILR